MKAVFLAAGRGSRLGNLTEEMPKCLLKICNNSQTLLSYNLNNLYESGIKDYIFITGFMYNKLESYVKSWAKNKNVFIKCIYNPFWNYCNVLGSFYFALNELDSDFLYLHADTVVDKNVLTNLIIAKGDYVLAVDLKKCGDEEMKVIIDNGAITDISKEISIADASGEFVGVAKFSRKAISFLKNTAIQIFNEKGLNFYMEEALQAGILKKKIKVNWIDCSKFRTIEVDFIEDLQIANQLFI
jgi:choline kinase